MWMEVIKQKQKAGSCPTLSKAADQALFGVGGC